MHDNEKLEKSHFLWSNECAFKRNTYKIQLGKQVHWFIYKDLQLRHSMNQKNIFKNFDLMLVKINMKQSLCGCCYGIFPCEFSKMMQKWCGMYKHEFMNYANLLMMIFWWSRGGVVMDIWKITSCIQESSLSNWMVKTVFVDRLTEESACFQLGALLPRVTLSQTSDILRIVFKSS